MSESETIYSALPMRALRIGEVTFDLNCRRVERDGTSVELSQRPFDLLCLFLAEPHTLHTRKDIFRRIWKGVVVEDSNLTQSVWLLRRALGESGKEWIRTVAKSGYVFAPPFTIHAVDEAVNDEDFRAPTEDDEPPLPVAAPPEPEPVATPSRRRPWGWFVAAAASVVVAVAIAAGIYRVAASSREPLRVVLVTVDPVDATAGQHVPTWPVQLLREWLEWKLSREPDVVVVTAPQLAGADHNGRVVLLSVVGDSDEPEQLRMYAHLSDAGGSRDVVVEGGLDAMAPAADRVSTDVANLLLPGGERRYPAITLDLDAAQDYVVAVQRSAEHRHGEAVAAFEAVLRQAPDFGLARMQLAEVLDELDQVSAAKQQIAAAAGWFSKLPAEALRVQQAQELMLRRDYAAAAEAYTALIRRYPQQPRYGLALARALTHEQRSNDALAVLDRIDWSVQPPQLRINALLERAAAQREAGASDEAKRTATQADELAADEGWPLERGRALLIFAYASIYDDSADKWLAFDRAATQFELAGNRMGALSAQLGGETMRPFGTDPVANRAADARLSALLGEARTAGNRDIEIGALRLAARRLRRAGEFTAAREQLVEASAVARAAGDLQRDSALQLDLAHVALGLGDLDAAERYLEAIDMTQAQGNVQWWKRMFAARIALRRGRFDIAEKTLGSTPAENAALPLVASMLECDRADLEHARGNTDAARSAAQRCMSSNLPFDVAAGRLALARIAQDEGDAARAVNEVELARTSIAKLPQVDRLLLDAIATTVLARTGDREEAQRVLGEIATRAGAGGMRLVEVEVRLGLAEIALARGAPAEADVQIAAARRVAPAGDWSVAVRIGLLDAARDYGRGEAGRARDRLRDLDTQARDRGDVTLELGVHALAAAWGDLVCPEKRDEDLRVRSGLQGIAGRWPVGRHAEAKDRLAAGKLHKD